jgi:hypothetical protein
MNTLILASVEWNEEEGVFRSGISALPSCLTPENQVAVGLLTLASGDVTTFLD